MRKPGQVLRQNGSTVECRSVGHACMLLDVPCRVTPIEDLHRFADELRSGSTVPVGTVEYVNQAMRSAGREPPEWSPYPECLSWALRREVRQVRACEVKGGAFIKPVQVKRFTGFVMPSDMQGASMCDSERESLEEFNTLAPWEMVWTSEVVKWQSEHRYYVTEGKVVGSARYDEEGVEEAPEPDKKTVQEAVLQMVDAHGPSITCSLDFGVLEGGETALVEANDGYALGLYSGALGVTEYLRMLATRWWQLMDELNKKGL